MNNSQLLAPLILFLKDIIFVILLV